MCFVVFCVVFRVFCDVLQVFCGVLRVFCSISTKHTKRTRKTLENTKNSQYARVLREFSKSKKIRLYCTKHFSQNICKTHRKTPQNTAKQSRNAFCEIKSQNTAKCTQNARKRHKTLTIQPQYVLRAFGVFSQNTLDLSRKHTIRNTRVNYGGGFTYPQGVT